MNALERLVEELRALVARENKQLASGVPDPRNKGYREGFRDAAEYAADGIEEALEDL